MAERQPLKTDFRQRKRISVNGIVQGVGFRPFVFNLAKTLGLTGTVTNTASGVAIEAEGSGVLLDRFITSLEEDSPPLSIITKIEQEIIPANGEPSFSILPSKSTTKVATLISPDVTVCNDCLHEVFDPADRRYLYPFINCTNCGPRFTIINSIPYDRPFTSMADFKMCSACQSEYDNPSDRRFHAQPNACPECGPHVRLTSETGKYLPTEDPIEQAASLLKTGHCIAIKGLGGFHLAVDATNESAVQKLRQRKHREEKPLALMMKDLNTVRHYANISKEEEEDLLSIQHPIVLLIRKNDKVIASNVAPGNDRLGVMLPYTPLHHVLFHYDLPPLVMTSANLSEEPICIENSEAFNRLKGIADYFLIHNRDIYLRSDDSITIHLADKKRIIRKSRGFVPRPVIVNSTGPPILAVGGELKNTVCLLKDNLAFLSQHIGDLENLESYTFFQKTIDHFQQIFETKPEMIVHDLHPGYLSTQWANEQGPPLFAVQHHHAHLAACMAEHQLSKPVIGLIMDGTGYGTDGSIWGGEVLIGDYSGFNRFAHFEPLPLPGGDAAIKAPWRTAVSYLQTTFDHLPTLPFLDEHDFNPVVEMVTKNINSPQTSSCGRLFDAVASMCGGRQTIRYEGQAAIEFMQAADHLNHPPFEFSISKKTKPVIMMIAPILHSIVKAIENDEPFSRLAGRFHKTLVNLFHDICLLAKKETGINTVVLSGGVFQNPLLFETLILGLRRSRFTVFTHEQVPTNDGGIALGQALVGRQHLKEALCV